MKQIAGFVALIGLLTGGFASAQSPSPTPTILPVAPEGPVAVIDLDTGISKAQFLYLRRAIKEAEMGGASAIILNMNTYGGELGAAIDTMEALLRVNIPTYTYVNTNAGSAGALIALATDQIYMAPVSAIGAAAPVSSSGEDINKTMQQKTVSYFGGIARSVAQKKGHNPDLVAGFLDAEAEVKIGDKVISPKGELMTLTAEEAVERIDDQPVLAEAIVGSVDELIDREGLSRERLDLEPSGFETVALWITRLAPIFLLVGIAGAYLEFKTPGFGIPGIVAAIAFLFFFTGHYIAGLTGYGTVLLFFLGALLVVIEIFFLPGTLVLGLVGGLLMLGTLLWAMVDQYPAEGLLEIDPSLLGIPLLNLTLAFILAGFAAWALAAYLPKVPLYRGFILTSVAGGPSTDAARASQVGGLAPVPEDPEALPPVGSEGMAMSDLRPSGKVRIGEHYLDAIVHGEWLEEGTKVVVMGSDSGSVLVRGADEG